MFWVSFLQQLPQQMPEMSRCPNGTECFHNKAGVRREERAYIRLFPPAPELSLFFFLTYKHTAQGAQKELVNGSHGEQRQEMGPGCPHPLHLPIGGRSGLQQDPRAGSEGRASLGPATDPVRGEGSTTGPGEKEGSGRVTPALGRGRPGRGGGPPAQRGM